MNASSRPNLPNSLHGKLSKHQAALFIQKALPGLKRDYAELGTYLQNQQWQDAARQAHKLKSIIKLLGLESLLPFLDAIENQGLDSQTGAFRANLNHACQNQFNLLAETHVTH